MIILPEKIRRALDRTVKSLRAKEDIYGVGLFGSWSRGDASVASDVDLMILDSSSKMDYVERSESGGVFIDFYHVPKGFLANLILPDLDQKLFELQILYDRDWSLTNTKIVMTEAFNSPERVNIRTEAHIVDSDIFLSRASSAFSRGDFKSSWLFAIQALEHLFRVLMEIASEPYSNSQFLARLRIATKRLELSDYFNEYERMSRLSVADDVGVKIKLKLLKSIWDETNAFVRENLAALDASHSSIKSRLGYCLNTSFIQGVMARTNLLADTSLFAEAQHYLSKILFDIVEGYVWFRAWLEYVRVDLSMFMISLESLETRNRKNYLQIEKALGLTEIADRDASDTIMLTRRASIEIRNQRKALIKNHVLNR